MWRAGDNVGLRRYCTQVPMQIAGNAGVIVWVSLAENLILLHACKQQKHKPVATSKNSMGAKSYHNANTEDWT